MSLSDPKVKMKTQLETREQRTWVKRTQVTRALDSLYENHWLHFPLFRNSTILLRVSEVKPQKTSSPSRSASGSWSSVDMVKSRSAGALRIHLLGSVLWDAKNMFEVSNSSFLSDANKTNLLLKVWGCTGDTLPPLAECQASVFRTHMEAPVDLEPSSGPQTLHTLGAFPCRENKFDFSLETNFHPSVNQQNLLFKMIQMSETHWLPEPRV